MVVVNLYAFEKTASKPGVNFQELIENIDIGGPSMVRSAAKNFQDVAIVTSPADYDAIAEEMQSNGGDALVADQVAAGAEGIRDHRGLRFGDCFDAGAGCCAERKVFSSVNDAKIPGDAAARIQQGIRSALRRESAPESCAVQRWLGHGRCQRQAAPGQGAQLQQHCRSAGGMGPGAGVRGAGMRNHQAHQSLRHCDGQEHWPKLIGARWSAIRCRRLAA